MEATSEMKSQALLPFNQICFARQQAQVLVAVDKICCSLPGMMADLKREGMLILESSTETFHGEAITPGLHAISVAEESDNVERGLSGDA
jgi:hypothetical protein